MTPTADRTALQSRRQLLVTGTLGAAAAAFLAACGTDNPDNSGASGVDPTTTSVTPTVPLKEIAEADIIGEQQNLATAASLEYVVAEAYDTYGPTLSDPRMVIQAARIADEHRAFGDEFNAAVKSAEQKADGPNEWVQTNMIDPVDDQMVADRPIFNLLSGLESMLTATYASVIASATTADWRARWAAIAGGAARRSALMGNGGDGLPPTAGAYPLANTVSNNAKLVTPAPEGE